MAYQPGEIIEANGLSLDDYNELATLINEVYGDAHPGNRTPGVGDYGYGQIPEIPLVSSGDLITAAQWTTLFDALHKCATHQGIGTGSVPQSVSAGNLIEALVGAGGLPNVINDIRGNRLNIAPAEAAVTSGGAKLSEVRTQSWTNSVVHEFDVSFANVDEARYFFNSGGEIRWSGNYTPGTPDESSEETAWSSSIAAIQTVTIGANYATSGSGLQQSLGYYGLTTSYSIINVKTIVTGGVYNTTYAGEQIVLSARLTNASANVVRIKVEFITDPAADRVLNGTLTSNVDQRKSVGQIVVTEPTYTTVVFSGS